MGGAFGTDGLAPASVSSLADAEGVSADPPGSVAEAERSRHPENAISKTEPNPSFAIMANGLPRQRLRSIHGL